MDVFGGAPRFLAYPRPVLVQSGADAVLKCQIGGDPRPAVIWERNNEKIDPQGRYRVFEDGNVYNLIITAVAIEDSGQYICKAKNGIGETYAAATLKVEGEAQEMELREENKPRFLIKPLSTRAGRGEDAVFSCKLWGNPRPEVTWEKDGRKLSEIFESTHFSVSYQDGGWFQLKIFKTRAPDGGVYTCKARNEFGEALAGAVLLVDAGPGHEDDGNRNGYTNGHRKAHQGKQRSSRQMSTQHKDETTTRSTRVKMFAVTEGKHAKFRCFVTGKPKPEIIWRKDGRLILSGRRYLLYEDREGYFTLKVLYCKQKDNGVYVCAASNTAGQTLSAVHLSVKEPPVRFKQPLIDLEVWEQDLAVLECEVPEDSVPITWYLEDRRLQPGAKYGMEEWGTKRRLTIRDIGVDDDGIYLCEMPDGGRSIAEVAVKGPIMRKLPRKVDVLEGENAAFCVEVEKEEMDIHWYKDGVELRETHQTILKSFGRTHILVFVNTMPQDSGYVTFFVGRSKTSSQLRVKAAKHCPPSSPVGVQINTERANAALLSWTPAQDSRKNPPSGYVLERQEVGTGSQEWLQCLTTDSATSVEILGDSVPCEADYRFRICSVNKYGKSNNVEFPRAVHLVPVARIQAPLQDALVPEGQDAVFSIELSASVIGSWFLNGTQLQEDERFSMRRSRTHQSLRIQGVRDTENGAEITFIAYGIRDSAALYIQAPLVKFSPLSEMDRNKFVEIGNPIVLYCELSDPVAPVHWYKNGVELQTTDGLHIQSEGTMRRIVIQSAEFSHSGVYCCDAIDDVIRFNVEVEAPSVRFSATPEAERNKTIYAGCPIILQCELSDHDAQVHWYKDGAKLFPQSGVDIQTDGLVRKLVIPSADFYHSGLYCCKTKGDTITFSVNIKAPPVKFCTIAEEMRTKWIEEGSPVVLQCVVSDPEALVCWFKDETELMSDSDLEIHSEGNTRTLVVQSAELCHSGVYQCTTKDDTMDFQVAIKAKPVMSSTDFDFERTMSFEMDTPMVLESEIADPTLPVQCYTDGVKLFPLEEWNMPSQGTLRQLIVPTELMHSGQYDCETSDDTGHVAVDIKAPLVPLSPSPKCVEKQSLEAPCPTEPACEIANPAAQVSLQKAKATDLNLEQDFKMEAIKKTLVIEPTHPSNSGAYYCATADDVAPLVVNNQVPAVTYGPDVQRAESAEVPCPIVQQFEISDPIAKACWYKDGTPVSPKMESFFEPESSIQVFPSPVTFDVSDDAGFSCETSGAPLNEDIKADQCHYGDEIDEVSDASVQITADVKAKLPRFASEQEKKTSTQGACFEKCLFSKHKSGIFNNKSGDSVTYEEHSRHKTTLPALENTTEWISTKDQKEHNQRRVNTEFPSDCSSVKPSTMKHDIYHHTKHFTESQGEKSFSHIQETEDPQISEQLITSLQTAVPSEVCNFLRSVESEDNNHKIVTGQLEEHHSSAQTAVLSELGNHQKTSNLRPKPFINDLEPATVSLDRFYISEKSPHSKKLFSSLQSATFQAEERYNSTEMPVIMTNRLNCIQTATLYSDNPSDLIQPDFYQSEDVNSQLGSSTVSSTTSNAPGSSCCLELYDSQCPEIMQPKGNSNCQTSSVKPEEISQAEQAGCTQQYPTLLKTTVQTDCHHNTDAAKDQICSTLNSGKGSSWLFSGSACSKQTSHVQSDESYPTGTFDSHNIVAANKVAVEAPPVRISTPCQTEMEQSVEVDEPTVLWCETSNPISEVTRYKDGIKPHEEAGQDMQVDDSTREVTLHSAAQSDTGAYSCMPTDDRVQFQEDAKVPLQKFSAVSEAEQKRTVMAGCPVALQCELSDPTGQVTWYKDGTQLLPQSGIDIQSKENLRSLVIPAAKVAHSGVYRCESKDDGIQFTVEVKALPTKFSELQEAERNKTLQEGCAIVLSCELAQDSDASVDWYKDGIKLHQQNNLEIQIEGRRRALFIPSSENTHSGIYKCVTADDTITFNVDVKGRLPQIMPIPQSEKYRMIAVGSPIMLQCEVLDSAAQVSWFKDETELFCKTGLDMKRGGSLRKLIIHSAKMSDSGLYSCKLGEDVVTFHVDIEAAPVRFAAIPDKEKNKLVEAGCPVRMQCEVSEPTAQVQWHKDGEELFPKGDYEIQTEEKLRALVIKAAEVRHSGVYCCDSADDHIEFKVDVAAPPVTFADIPEEELFKSTVEKSQLDLSCQVSQVDGVVQWYKDGAEIHSNDNITMQAEGTKRNLSIQSAQLSDSGMYMCRAGDNTIMFKVNIREPPVMIIYPKEDVHLDRHVPEEIILSCELSRPNGVVSWYKDGQKLQESENIKLKIEGPYRRLKILTSGVEDSGEYVCDTADDSIFFNLSITEPPVRIVSPSQSQMELCQQTSERMVLSCEISRPHAVVRWYRDGLEVEESDNLILEVDGVYRRLIIPETTVKDSAEYVCDTIDDSMTFFVNIAEPPVRFVRPRKMLSRVEKVVGETMVLDCEVSRPNAVVLWKKNGEEVEDSTAVTIVEDGVMRQLTIHSLTLEDAGIYVCDAKDDVMDFHVKVQELPVTIIGKTNAKTEKQFLVSDDIILVCELSRPNASVCWYKNDQRIDDTEQYCSEEQGVFRSLVVLNASLEDSGEYTCDALDDKMVFHITVAEPPVKIVGNSGHPEHHILLAGEELILECEVSQPNATVQWLWNGEILKPDTRVKIYSHDVMRKLVLSGLQPSDSGKYVCDAADDKLITIVEVQEEPVKFVNKKANDKILAYENESVTLCAVVSQDKVNVRWLKDGQLLNKDNIHISSEGNTHKLTINPLQLSDSGDYVCDASTDEMYFSLFVKEMKVKFIRPLENVVSLKGSSLTLRCEINKPKGDVQWLKDGQEISPSHRYRIRAQGRERSFTVHEVVDEDAGEYACESTDDRTSAVVTVNTPRVVEFIGELHNITVCEGEDAVFKCMVSPEDIQLVWCLNGKQVALNERTVVSSNGLCHMLCIHNCMVSDSGIVTADAEGLVSKGELQVQEQQVMFTKKMAPVTAEEYSEATLEVEVSLDSSEVQWMRQGVLLHPGPKYTLKHKGPKHSLTIHNLAKSDRGSYSCETLHDRTQAQLTVEHRKITIKKGLTDVKTMERETATFEVELSHSNVPSTWWRNGIQLKPTNHFRMSAKGQVHSLTISNLSVEDTATLMFCVENLKTSARLVVKEPPVTIFRKLEDQKFPEGAIFSIECELSRHNVDVKWMKNGSEVKPGRNVRIYAIGRKRFLQITKCHVSDCGVYTCDAGEVTTCCTVEVYERELLILQALEDVSILEDQNAVFVCEISVEDIPGLWYKNREMIQQTSTIKIRQEGTKHFLLMCNVRPEDSGEIKFVARHVDSVAQLKVTEIPVSIVKPLQDKTALEKSRVILDCTVSNPRCSIRWYKGSNVILPSERFEISSEGCYRKLIIQQVVVADEGTYSMQVGEHTCSAKLTVERKTNPE
ncbi:obscurin-like protein 1 isoform X4 [Dunckerocampus dactyliophorus]|uniref:obscurin-like protein 1 isoform X4 n=1 Tax=Dunckerocampus dactyliophorus TaxID=161453 RepID=UPI00240716CE|nr:obscurin-like protein 1 isoform X4 [Dunckerocampus dactyliophorus]